MVDYKYRNKIYKNTRDSLPGYFLKVDENGSIGFSSHGLYSWDSPKWRCGFHNHWKGTKLENMEVVYEHNLSLENK